MSLKAKYTLQRWLMIFWKIKWASGIIRAYVSPICSKPQNCVERATVIIRYIVWYPQCGYVYFKVDNVSTNGTFRDCVWERYYQQSYLLSFERSAWIDSFPYSCVSGIFVIIFYEWSLQSFFIWKKWQISLCSDTFNFFFPLFLQNNCSTGMVFNKTKIKKRDFEKTVIQRVSPGVLRKMC